MLVAQYIFSRALFDLKERLDIGSCISFHKSKKKKILVNYCDHKILNCATLFFLSFVDVVTRFMIKILCNEFCLFVFVSKSVGNNWRYVNEGRI